MATTADAEGGVDGDPDLDLDDVDERLTAELCRQLALGNEVVTLGALARETGATPVDVETCMANYEMQETSVERVGGSGTDVQWRLRGGGQDG